MATVAARYLRNGSITWRVQFRRVGCPWFSKSFTSKKEAREYAIMHEASFIENPEKYIRDQNFLEDMRKREFKRKPRGL